jgi:hypothetical protein
LTGSLQGTGIGIDHERNNFGRGRQLHCADNFAAPASQTTDAIFTGTVSGNQMSGTVQVVGRGAGTFTATRAGRPTASPRESLADRL